MRHIFNSIASFVHRKTRSPGVLWLRRKLGELVAVLYQHRKQIFASLFVVAICGVYLGASGTVFAESQKLELPDQYKKGFFGNFNPVSWAIRIFNEILSILVGLAGKLATLLISILMNIAQYNDFLSSTAVANGWVVTRDIANMFFIIILLVIAFGTILGSGDYNTKMLGKLLVMAVVINFSRTIVGIMIDASQIIMLTFVNGFSAAGEGNFINAFGVARVLQYQKDYAGEANVTGLALIGASLLMGLVLMGVACWVLVTIVGTLLFRIAYIWFLIVISPIAWLMSTFPAGKKYYAQWWDQFRDQLVVGPAMAFFLWLSLTAVGSGLAWNQVIVKGKELANVELGITQILTSENMLSFAITIVLLVASKEMAQKLAGSASGYGTFMKSYMNTLARGKKIGVGALKTVDRFQADSLGTGLTISNIPQRFQEGMANRKKLIEKRAESNRQKRARQLRNLPLGLGVATSMVWAPEPVLEKAFTGVANGKMLSRAQENLFGAYLNNKLFKKGFMDKQGAKKKKLQDANQKEVDNLAEYENASGLLAGAIKDNADARNTKDGAQTLLNNLAASRKLTEPEHRNAVHRGLLQGKMADYKEYKKLASNSPALQKAHAEMAVAAQDKLGKAQSDLSISQTQISSLQAKGLGTPEEIAQKIAAQKTKVAEMKKLTEEGVRKLDEASARRGAWFAKGDSGLRDSVERKRVEAEQEAYKKIDQSATNDEWVSDLLQAINLKDEAMVAQLVKLLAKRGQIEAAFPALGIAGGGGLENLKQLETVLTEKVGMDGQYALQTLLRVSNNEFEAGSLDNGNLLQADKINGLIDWRTEVDAAEMTRKRIIGKSIQKILPTLSVKTLFRTNKDGNKRLTQNAIPVFELMNKNPQAVADGIRKGYISMELIEALDPYFDQVEGEFMTRSAIEIIREAAPAETGLAKRMGAQTIKQHIKRLKDQGKDIISSEDLE